MKKICTLLSVFLLWLTPWLSSPLTQSCMAADISLTASKYAYNKWSQDYKAWYVSFASADGAYSMRMYYQVEDATFPSPYTHVTLQEIDTERSYIQESKGLKNKHYFNAADLEVQRTDAGQMTITGTIGSGNDTFLLQVTGDGVPAQLTEAEYLIEASEATLLSTEYVHPGTTSLFAGRDTATGDSLVIAVVGEKVEGYYSTAEGIISTTYTRLIHADGTSVRLFCGLASVSREGGVYTVEAALLFEDCCLYNIVMNYHVAAGETYEIVCTNTEWTDYTHIMGAAWAQGSEEHFENILVQMGNLYSMNPTELDQENFLVEMWLPGAPATRASVTSQTIISARLTRQQGQLVLLAEFVGNDNNYYKLDMRYNRPEPRETIALSVQGAAFYNALESGYYQVSGYTADSLHWVSLLIMSEEVPGTFSIEGNTLQKDYTMVWEAATDTEKLLQWGEAVVTLDETGAIAIEAQLLAKDSLLYTVTMSSQYDRPRFTYDTQDQPVELSYGADTDNQLRYVPTEYGVNYLEFTLRDSQTRMLCQLGFWIEELDADYYLPAGTYPITRTYTAGTLQASSGVVNGGVNASFVSAYDGESIMQPLWFMDCGECTVTHADGYLGIEVSALNSYEQPITIHFSDRVATALDAVRTDSTFRSGKRLEHGSIVIVQGDQRLDLYGRKK